MIYTSSHFSQNNGTEPQRAVLMPFLQLSTVFLVMCGAMFCGETVFAEEEQGRAKLASKPAGYSEDLRLIRRYGGSAIQRQPFVLEASAPADRIEMPAGDNSLEEAILLVQDKAYAEAIPLLEASLERMPTVEAVWEALGWSYYGVGRTNDVEKLWTQYITLRPDSTKANSLMAQLAILRSDWVSADTYLGRGLELDPDNYDIRYWYAQNLFRLGRLPEALDIIEKLSAEDDMRYDVKVDLARIYTLLQRYEDALDLWTDILDVMPANLHFRTEYARVLMFAGGLEEADEQAKRVLAEDPSSVQAMMIRADVAELSQNPEIIEKSLLRLIDQADDGELKAQLRVRLADRYLALHRKDAKIWPLDLALEQYEEAVDAVPDYVPWLNQYAAVALIAGKPGIARRITGRILKDINPYNQQALRTRFELAMYNRDFETAERALDTLYDMFDPDNPYKHFDRARIEVQRGKYFNAMDELDEFEVAGHSGALLTLLYHGLTESEWMALTSTRRLEEHLIALRSAGYSFIAASDIQTYLKAPRANAAGRETSKPWGVRLIDKIRYAFTGKPSSERILDRPPEKVAVVTFDDGLRSSFRLGTPIAQDLEIPFWMAVITHIEELNAPGYAAWDEIKNYRDSGAWEIGSHLMRANTDRPAGPEPARPVATLPNRIWLKEKKRLETIREWTKRVRHEFEGSRELIEKRLGLESGQSMAVAYPYSDIGQSEGSNVARLLNPVRTILNEASRQHETGFIVDERGFTTASDNLLMVRRYEPEWHAEAEDVVEHVMTHHPVMMARRLRAEIASLSDRPYLAAQQIELLRRDGYPEKQLRELIAFIQKKAVPAQAASELGEADQKAGGSPILKPSNFYISAALQENQSSEEIRQSFSQFKAGINLNPSVGIEASWRDGSIKQTVTSNIWYTVKKTETSSIAETRTETVNGVTTVSEVQVNSSTTRDVQTNRIDKYGYQADVQEWRGALTLRVSDDATIGLTMGEKTVDYQRSSGRAPRSESEPVGSALISWKPYHALTVSAVYDRDLVPSAIETVSYDALGLGVFWKVRDDWELASNSRYASYEDKNAMVSITGSSFWQLIERQGIWGGFEASVYSMDDDSEIYWSPYWDTRYAGVLRLRRAYPLYFFQFDLRLGQQKEKGRPEDVNEYRNLVAQAEADGTWDPGTGPGAPRDTFVGLAGTWRQRVWGNWDLFINGTVNFLRDYSEHDISAGVQLNF